MYGHGFIAAVAEGSCVSGRVEVWINQGLVSLASSHYKLVESNGWTESPSQVA